MKMFTQIIYQLYVFIANVIYIFTNIYIYCKYSYIYITKVCPK